MDKLPYDRFIKARDYIFAHSEDIGRAWFRYNFEDGDTDVFMDVLAEYQHENGGFGGLFYEFDYQGPCLKSTEIAIGSSGKAAGQPPGDSKYDAVSIGAVSPGNRQLGRSRSAGGEYRRSLPMGPIQRRGHSPH